MITRKLGKFLRGKATPFQIMSATLLGALLAAAPGFAQAPLLSALLFACLVVVNANLFVGGISFLIAKLVYWMALPAYFSIGVWLAEGPLRPVLTLLVNAPVLAWFGLEYYVVVPALLAQGVLGIIGGLLISRGLRGFRRKMATLEGGSEAYRRYTGKLWVKALGWLFMGGLKGKESWEELSATKGGGLPIRPLGIVFVLGLSVLGFVGFKILDRSIVTHYVREALEQFNGATVDLASVEIDLPSNRITLAGLALADPEDLSRNRFVADTLVAELSGISLLAKKAVIDQIEVDGARVGSERRFPGQRIRPREQAEVDAAKMNLNLTGYLKDAGKWQERFASFKKVYDQLAPFIKQEQSTADEPEAENQHMDWREQLAERARQSGYASIAAESLVARSPRIVVRRLKIDPIRVEGKDLSFKLRATNLSSHPLLVPERGTIRLRQSDGNLELEIQLPSAEQPATSAIRIQQRQISIDALRAETDDKFPFSGGTLSVEGQGVIDAGYLDLPIQVVARNTAVLAAGRSVKLKELPLQVRLYGPLEQPRIMLPKDALKDVLLESGKQQIEELIQDKAGDSLRKILPFGKDG